jgi:hypothetical protein
VTRWWMSSSALSVRPIHPHERARFDESLGPEHSLGVPQAASGSRSSASGPPRPALAPGRLSRNRFPSAWSCETSEWRRGTHRFDDVNDGWRTSCIDGEVLAGHDVSRITTRRDGSRRKQRRGHVNSSTGQRLVGEIRTVSSALDKERTPVGRWGSWGIRSPPLGHRQAPVALSMSRRPLRSYRRQPKDCGGRSS